MSDKTERPTKLLWVDMEMTGLNVEQDVIIEVAVIVTDFNFKTLATYETIVRQPQELVTERLRQDPWWAQYSENREEFINKIHSGKSPDQVEKELLKLIDQHFGPEEPVVLAGNSIHNDRRFIKKYWPQLNQKLHYRMLDVSAWKVLMQGKYDIEFEKHKAHRALDDIQESIAELQYYLQWFNDGS